MRLVAFFVFQTRMFFAFSCILAELFTEQPLFSLTQMLNYRINAFDPKPLVEKIADKDIRVRKWSAKMSLNGFVHRTWWPVWLNWIQPSVSRLSNTWMNRWTKDFHDVSTRFSYPTFKRFWKTSHRTSSSTSRSSCRSNDRITLSLHVDFIETSPTSWQIYSYRTNLRRMPKRSQWKPTRRRNGI